MLCNPLKVNLHFGGTCRLHRHAGYVLGLFFDPEDGGDIILRNVDWLQLNTRCYILQCPKSLEQMGILFIIYYLHYMPYMFTPTLYAFSQPLYHASADFAQQIGIDSSTTVCNSLPKVTKVSDFNSIHLPWRPLRSTISTLSSNVNAIFSLLTFCFIL
jgi:hypothetical protein